MLRFLFATVTLATLGVSVPNSVVDSLAPTILLVSISLAIALVVVGARDKSHAGGQPGPEDTGRDSAPEEDGTRGEAGTPTLSDALADVEKAEPEASTHAEALARRDAERLQREIEVRREIEARLLVAMEVAEAADNAKSEFLANVSHELRTPMTAIIASAQLLQEQEEDDHRKQILDIILSSSRSMMRLINDLLDYATTEAGRVKLDQTEFSLRENVAQTVRAFGMRAREKGIALAWDVDPTVPDVLVGDVNRVRQILSNLLDNALKFTSRGSVECHVLRDSSRLSGPAGDRVALHFAIRDTGIGIPADKRDVIFEAFRQGDGSTTRRFGGTGLGLAITRQLVDMMDGRIWIESEEGKGTAFHVIIQLAVARVPVMPTA